MVLSRLLAGFPIQAKGINRQARVNEIKVSSPFSLLTPCTIRAGTKGPQGLGHIRHDVRKLLGLGGRNPFDPEALRLQAEVFQH
jgi:hypothetical protein